MPRKPTIKNKALESNNQAQENQQQAPQAAKEIPPHIKALMEVCDFLRDRVKVKRAKVENQGIFKEYFRADEMIEIIQQNHAKIEKYLKGTTYEKQPGELKEFDNVLELGQEILNQRLCVKLSRTDDSKLLKWPKELLFKPGNIQFTKKSCFLTFTFEPDPRKRHIKLLFIIAGILVIALYPIWPLYLRVLVFKISFYLLISLVILTIIRYLLFGLLWICGIHFWIFPNLYADVGFFDSFKPLFSSGYDFERNIYAYIGRLGVIIVYGITLWYYLTYYDQFLNLRAGYSAGMQDIYDWGETKIAMKPAEPNLQNFRRTRNWYDEMMDEWTKEETPPPPEEQQKSDQESKEQVVQEEEDKSYLDDKEEEEDDDDEQDE